MIIDKLRGWAQNFRKLVDAPPESLKQVGISIGIRLTYLIVLAGIVVLIVYLKH